MDAACPDHTDLRVRFAVSFGSVVGFEDVDPWQLADVALSILTVPGYTLVSDEVLSALGQPDQTGTDHLSDAERLATENDALRVEIEALKVRNAYLDCEGDRWAETCGRLRSERYDLRVMLGEWADLEANDGAHEVYCDIGRGARCTCDLPSLLERTTAILPELG